MTAKDFITLIIVGIIIIALLFGLTLLIKNKSESNEVVPDNKGADESLNNTTIDNQGFEQRAQLQQNKTLQTTTEPKQTTQSAKTQLKSAPPMQLQENIDYRAEINTSKGMIIVDLYEKEAPITVNNFVYLAKSGFYDGLIFHRVMDDFMIQGGDPLGTGAGGPGYSFQDEINDKKLVKGSLAMANSRPNTNGSQFFIVTKESTPWLDGKHTNFGQVIQGMEVADKIQKVQVGAGSRPLENVVIESIKIYEKPI